MAHGFFMGGVVKMDCVASLTSVGVQTPDGVFAYNNPRLGHKHYHPATPKDSIGADFFFFRVNDVEERSKEEVLQMLRELKVRPASAGETFSLAHKNFETLTGITHPRPRVAAHRPGLPATPSKLCFFCLGSRIISQGLKYNPLVVREESNVVIRALNSDVIRNTWFVPVTDHRFRDWK